MRTLAQRLRHLPHERRAVALPSLHGAARSAATISPPASSWRRASPTWTAPSRTRATFGWSREPIIEMLIPSTLDDSLAPPGAACRQPVLPARRAAIARRKILGRPPRGSRRPHDRDRRTLRAGFRRQRPRPPNPHPARSRTPVRPARRRHLPRRADASTNSSPRARCSATPIIAARCAGLYHCGAGAHPGGGVTGAPGHNAAGVILGDLRRIW